MPGACVYIVHSLLARANFAQPCQRESQNIPIFAIKECNIEDLLAYIIKNKLYASDEFIKENLNLFIELFFYKNINNSKNISFKIKKYFYLKLSFVKKYNLDFESFFLEFNDKLLSE